jgi:hypothetical protein
MSTTTTRPLTPGRKATLIVGGVFAFALILYGAWMVASVLGITTDEQRLTLSPTGERLTIDTDGDIRIRTGGDQIQITERIRHSIGRPNVRQRSIGDGIVLRGDCPWYTSTCQVSMDVTVPTGLSLDLRTSAGGITVTGVEGDVEMSSSAGDVRASGLRSKSVEARSSAGAVDLGFDAAPSTVTAHSSAGEVSVRLPQTPGGYQVHASTSAGTPRVNVASDPNSARVIDATSSAGDVTVGPS